MATNCTHSSPVIRLVVTCEGTLGDPEFPQQFQKIVDRLDDLLGVPVKVRKLEPWNSVRVTLSVPREAALYLRQLAQQGAPQLRALGILSVQLDGEGVVSLKLHGANGEPQEVVLRTAPARRSDPPDGGQTTSSALSLGALLPTAAGVATGPTTTAGQVPFKSPNVVCPPDTVVPRVGASLPTPPTPNPLNKPPYAGPFPFASMNQAIHSQSSSSSSGPASVARSPSIDPPPFLPPPYPGVRRAGASPGSLPPVRTPHPSRPPSRTAGSESIPLQGSSIQPPVTISSPLLVNLLQNDHQAGPGTPSATPPPPAAPRQMRPPPPPASSASKNQAPPPLTPQTALPSPLKTAAPPHQSAPNHVTSQANVLASKSNNNTNSLSSSSSVSPSALITSVAPSLIPGARPVQDTGQTRVQHYQRTPQGSIIAINKPLQNAMPLHQQNHRSGSGVLRPQFGMLQKSNSAFQPNNLPPNAPKIITHVNNALNSNSAIVSTHNPPMSLSVQLQLHPLNRNDVLSHQVVQTTAGKPLPSPPPYSVAVSSRPHWESIVSNPATLLDLPPSLTDLKADDLDDLLPSLSHSPLPELSELELLGPQPPPGPENGITTDTNDGRKYLINPLTGELEPHSSDESDTEEVKDVFTDLPSPLGMSDEDTNSTTRPDTTTDQSDSETRSSTDGKHSRVKNTKARREGRDSPALKSTEKIKLRLMKLEKSEPVNAAYKVDISFVNAQQPKKASASILPPAGGGSTPAGEELRVPPLHISLRGRNSAVIKNKSKGSVDGAKKVRKLQLKAREGTIGSDDDPTIDSEHRKLKKQKSNHDHRELMAALADDPSKFNLHNHYKDKQKERRGSDSDLVRSGVGRKHDANGALTGDEKRRRLSQSEGERRADDETTPTVPGSTNVGTLGVLPPKVRKDKIKIKESFKIKDNRKMYASVMPKTSEKTLQKPMVALPTATDLDMEAKFKQSLMEGAIGEKGVPRPPHRTVEVVSLVADPGGGRPIIPPEKIPKIPLDPVVQTKEKTPEPDKCNVPDRKTVEEGEKQLNAIVTTGSRSPNSGSNGGQGEDSGIESMDALSEKSPNQASQSPHGDILSNVHPATSKTQVPDMLDIESQLAKMEGLEHHDVTLKSNAASTPANDVQASQTADKTAADVQATLGRPPSEDVNENECIHRSDSKACCDLTCTLQDKIEDKEQVIAVLKGSKKDDQPSPNSPPSLRVASALYTYPSNPGDKGGGGGSRGSSESPLLTTEDEDSNPGTSSEHPQVNNKSKSLLEQLLIEIPSEHHGGSVPPSSHSPATRSSVRTRALSKLGSPELSSPIPKTAKTAPVSTVAAKRKRNESDSSNHSVDETRKRPRKGSEASELGKRVVPVQNPTKKPSKANSSGVQGQQDESSDSDEPLIEKLRKTGPKPTVQKAVKVPGSASVAPNPAAGTVNNKANTRRSARAGHQQEKQQLQVLMQPQQQQQQPAQNTRSREKVVQQIQQQTQAQGLPSNAEAEAALRRKTRSADMESKRKKEVK